MHPLFLVLSTLVCVTVAQAQPLTESERAQGYALRGDTTVFVFDAALYALNPERVVVTGAFRGWSDDMDDPAWVLTKGPAGLWTLVLTNPDYRAVGPATPFKFRVDDGRWLDPPADAPNAEGGNLVFLYGVTPSRLQAEVRGPRAVWAEVSGDDVARPLEASAYRLTRADGTPVRLATVIPHEATTALLVPAEDLNVRRVHTLEVEVGTAQPLRARVSFDGWFRTLYSDKPLGAEVREEQTTVRLFAPRADSLRLFLYQAPDGPVWRSHAMARDAQGVWTYATPEHLAGVYYDVAVYGPDEPGNHFFNQTGQRITDPYARASLDSWGRARMVEPTAPARPLPNGRPAMEDVVAYEVHVQDFTDLLPVGDDLVGTIPAMAVPGLTNSRGEAIGFDYLVDLGVNVVHLMPVQEYLHYPDDVWQAAFADDPFMQAQGIAEENYQWGYRITHYLAVESRYRQRGTEPGAEREQFRDLVQAFHDRGIAVIVDFVFNHTGENMEGRQQLLNFNGLDKWYYYRLNDQGEHIGVFGNEVKSEDRPMVQRWLLDQCKMYVEEFGVDGFRIDLAGQTDEQTLRWLRAQLPDDLIWYGEPWIGSNDPDFEANPSWDWYKVDSPITFFQDDARNAFKGPTSHPDPANVPASRGFAGGDGSVREAVKSALLNRYPDEATPNDGINYLDIHDNWALVDRFASCTEGACAWDGRQGVDEAAVRIAATLLLTSLGPVVVNGGTEILRSKGLAPLAEELGGQLVKETALSPIYLNGRGDTYNLRAANRYDWETVGWTPEEGAPADYAAMHAWWQGLIRFRLSEAGAVFRRGTSPPDDYIRFFEPENEAALGYLVDDRVLVLVNASEEPITFAALDLPLGRWQPIASEDQIDPEGLGFAMQVSGPLDLPVAQQRVVIWARE
ncbi:MAG: pullulanase [Rhodothermaceae bacterium]|nr:pullulanase [Rhodothermaceae bacterium]